MLFLTPIFLYLTIYSFIGIIYVTFWLKLLYSKQGGIHMALKYSVEGIKALERKLDSLKAELRELQIYKNKIAAENGDVWHDNNDFEQSEIEERRLQKSITDLEEEIRNAELISTTVSSSNVNYGAVVTVKILGEDDDPDDEDVITLWFSDSGEKAGCTKTNVNTPIGKLIFDKPVGFIGNYVVDNKGAKTTFTVEILDIQYPD